nr:hypothetical protein HUO10_000286 [Paraburkholderia busanensis]
MTDSLWDELERFVRREAGLGENKRLSPTTRLVEDLGQTGDDASEFMVRYFEHFDVAGGDFDFHRYFLMEGEGLLFSLFRRVVFRQPQRLVREPITLGMLHQALEDKHWDSGRLGSIRL